MSLLVVGISHRTAPLALLERVALDDQAATAVSSAAMLGEHVSELVTLATCNRVEVYADVVTFHGGVADLGTALSGVTGVPLEDLTAHLYVHYEDQAVAHLFTVVCGLDSMAVGEGQILGQGALRAADRPVVRRGPAGAGGPLPAGAAGRQAGPRRDRPGLGRPVDRAGRHRPGGRGAGRAPTSPGRCTCWSSAPGR